MKADYEKAEQAVKLLEESGVSYILVYDNGRGHKLAVHGEYKDIKRCIVCALVRAADHIHNNGYDEYAAVGELQKIAITATQLWYEQKEKKEEE